MPDTTNLALEVKICLIFFKKQGIMWKYNTKNGLCENYMEV